MKLEQLTVSGVRNLTTTTLALSPAINVIWGCNGSGKTSLLEAIYLLSAAKSFRARSLTHMIGTQAEEILLVAKLERQQNLGLTANRLGERRIRFQGQNLHSSAQLSQLFPVQILDQHIFRFLEEGPKVRRRFLDWGLFHVEQHFMAVWRNYQRVLTQRNQLLKSSIARKSGRQHTTLVNGVAKDKNERKNNDAVETGHEIKIQCATTSTQPNTQYSDQWQLWQGPLLHYGQVLDSQRKQYVARIKPFFDDILPTLAPHLSGIELRYDSGWRSDLSFEEALNRQLDTDIRLGRTTVGPHRADLVLSIDGVPLEQRLSRGQQKVVISALKLAQVALYVQYHQTSVVFLMDDLTAELDDLHRKALCRWLEYLKCQVFITCIEPNTVRYHWQSHTQVALFHVEQGRITRSSTIP